MQNPKVFKKGEVVKESGKYVCVPCGYHQEYRMGEKFGECTSCLNNKKDDIEDVEGTGMWEKKE